MVLEAVSKTQTAMLLRIQETEGEIPIDEFYTDEERIKKYNIKPVTKEIFKDKYQDALLQVVKTAFDFTDKRHKLFNEFEKYRDRNRVFDKTVAQLDELNERLDNGRDYLMGIEPKKLKVADALDALGFSRNGKKL